MLSLGFRSRGTSCDRYFEVKHSLVCYVSCTILGLDGPVGVSGAIVPIMEPDRPTPGDDSNRSNFINFVIRGDLRYISDATYSKISLGKVLFFVD